MTETERRRLWFEAAARLNVSTEKYPDWPERMALSFIAKLPEAPAGLLAFLTSEADAGRLPVERQTGTRTSYGRAAASSSYLTGEAVTRRPVRTEHYEFITASAADVAALLATTEVGRFVAAWTAPYRQPAEAHQEEAAPPALTPMRRGAIIEDLGRRWPKLAGDLDSTREWTKGCRVPEEESPDGKTGWYYLELIQAECRARWGGAVAAVHSVDLSPAGQLRAARK